MKHTIGFFLVTILSMPVFGQVDNRPSLKTVEVEGLLIEAKREFLLDNLAEAIDIYKKIIEKDEVNTTAYFEMAKAYEKLNQLSEAKANAKEAFSLDKDNEWFGVYYASFLIPNGEYKEAADVYEWAIRANPKNADYYYERAHLLAKSKKYEEAIAVYEGLESQVGISERSARNKHLIYDLIGKPTQAAEALEVLIRTFPSESQYYHILAQYYEKQGKVSKAKEVYQRALIIEPNDPIASIALAEDMKSSGNEVSYLLSLKPLFNRNEVAIDLKIKELYPYINKLPEVKEGVLDLLLDLSKTMIEVHSKEAKAYATYGDILHYSGSLREAMAQYNQALELDNSIFSVWEQVLLIHEALGQTDELLKRSEAAMDIFPNQPFVYYMNGLAYNRKQKYDDAIDALEQAMMMSGKDNTMKAIVHSALAGSYQGAKDYQKADENFEAALTLDDKNATVLNNYSYHLALRSEKLDKALKMIQLANEIKPNKVTILNTYGLVAYQSKDYKMAEKWLKKAIDLGGNFNPDILEHYGDALFQLEQKEAALEYWQKAKNLGATSPALNKKITEKQLD